VKVVVCQLLTPLPLLLAALVSLSGQDDVEPVRQSGSASSRDDVPNQEPHKTRP
jgi:hypothetical protein